MPVAAAISEVGDSTTIKISSKNQLTIPAAARKKYDFGEYALCTFTEEGILIQPIQAADSEDLTVELLRYLMAKGFEGDELLEKYEELKPKFIDFHNAVAAAEADIEAGRVRSYEAFDEEMKAKYGL